MVLANRAGTLYPPPRLPRNPKAQYSRVNTERAVNKPKAGVEIESSTVSSDSEGNARITLGQGIADSDTDDADEGRDLARPTRPRFSPELEEKHRAGEEGKLTESSSDSEEGAQSILDEGGENLDMDYASWDDEEGTKLKGSLQPGHNNWPS